MPSGKDSWITNCFFLLTLYFLEHASWYNRPECMPVAAVLFAWALSRRTFSDWSARVDGLSSLGLGYVLLTAYYPAHYEDESSFVYQFAIVIAVMLFVESIALLTFGIFRKKTQEES